MKNMWWHWLLLCEQSLRKYFTSGTGQLMADMDNKWLLPMGYISINVSVCSYVSIDLSIWICSYLSISADFCFISFSITKVINPYFKWKHQRKLCGNTWKRWLLFCEQSSENVFFYLYSWWLIRTVRIRHRNNPTFFIKQADD